MGLSECTFGPYKESPPRPPPSGGGIATVPPKLAKKTEMHMYNMDIPPQPQHIHAPINPPPCQGGGGLAPLQFLILVDCYPAY